MSNKTAIIISIVFLLICNYNLSGNETGIDEIPVFNYVTGRFDPSKHKDFINIKKLFIPCSSEMYLHREAANSLKLLLDKFKKDHKEIKIYIISATRNFYSQKVIWENKWNGKKKILKIPDINKINDPLEKAAVILEYSSMPGTSRHHWGTDFDINNLSNSYYEKGEGKIIYEWFKKNAAKYGFAQPYTAERKEGYKEEKWHWSYIPLAKSFLKNWNDIYKRNPELFIKSGLYAGSEKIGHLAPIYVNSINPECK